MNTLLNIFQGLLTFVFLMAGGMKLAQPRDKVIASGGKWAEDFSAGTIKAIGLGELICGLAVFLPQLLGYGTLVTTGAAGGIAFFMAGAFYTHLRRKEYPFLIVTGVLLLLAVSVGYFRYLES